LYTIREISAVQVSLVVMGSCAAQRAGSRHRAVTVRERFGANVNFTCGNRSLTVTALLLIAGIRIELGIEGHVEESDHHLFPALVAPADFFGGIRVVLVIDRVVEMGGTLDHRAFR